MMHKNETISLEDAIKSAVDSIKGLDCDSCMRTRLDENLKPLINEYNIKAVEIIENLMDKSYVKSNAASIIIPWLASVESTKTYKKRKELIEQSLYSEDINIRDAACTGLSILDDPCSISQLEKAYAEEKNPLEKKLMKKVIEQLEETKVQRKI